MVVILTPIVLMVVGIPGKMYLSIKNGDFPAIAMVSKGALF